MEALGIVANVIAVVDLSVKLGVVCGEYISKAFNATDDIRKLQDESMALAQNIGQALDLLEENSNDENHKRQLAASAKFRDDVKKCEKLLEDLNKRLDPGQNPSRFKIMGKSLMWPVTSKEVVQTIDILRAWRSSFDTALQVDTLYITRRMEDVLHLTNLPAAPGAAFDDYDNEHEPICHPDTRKDLLHQIVQWSDDPDGKCMFWLRGSAGTGKSTISRTVARLFSERKQLAGSFFFNRTREGRNKADMFATTIARQIIRSVPKLRDLILAAIQDEPDLGGKALQAQFQKLILEPLKTFKPDGPLTPTLLLVIDALDECDTEESVGYDPRFDRSRMIVGLLGKLAGITNIRVRLFITSRPEVPIRLGFRDDILDDAHQDVALHDIPLSIIQHDIKAFVESQLEGIRSSHRIPQQWPGDVIAAQLVDMSIPLFIYAATVCKFLQDRRFHPKDQLEKILSQSHNSMTRMEMTYSPVLNQLLLGLDNIEHEGVIGQFRKIVGSIILLADPLPMTALSQLLDISVGELSCHLDNLHSVLRIPDELQSSHPIQILHLSFREYLLDNNHGRNRFHIHEHPKHENILECCLQVMTGGFGNQYCLRKDICKLGESEPGILRKDVPIETIRECIPRHLEYACRYWVHHLERSQRSADNDTKVYDFLVRHFLHWLEAMSWLDCINQAANNIYKLQTVFGSMESEIAKFVHDARRFIAEHRYYIDLAPYQSYVTALLFSSRESLVKQAFQSEVPNWVLRAPGTARTWNKTRRPFQAFVYTSNAVAIMYSHDGSLLAMATEKEITVSLVASETVCGVKNDLVDVVSCMAFTSTNMVAVGLNSGSVLLWDWVNGREWTEELSEFPVVFLSSTSNGGMVYSFDDGRVLLRNDVLGTSHELPTRWISDDRDWLTRGSIFHSYDGKFIGIIEAEDPEHIYVYDAESGNHLQTIPAPEGRFFQRLAISPNHILSATSGISTEAQLWDLSGEVDVLVRQFPNILKFGDRLALNQQGMLAMLNRFNDLSIWDLRGSPCVIGRFSEVDQMCFSPDGRFIATTMLRHGEVSIIDTNFLTANYISQEDAETRACLDAGDSLPPCTAACSPDSSHLATISSFGKVSIWDCAERKGIFTPPDRPITIDLSLPTGHEDVALCWTKDGTSLVVALPDQLILFLAQSLIRVHSQVFESLIGTDFYSSRSRYLLFSPCGSRLVMSDTIDIWNGETAGARVQMWDFPSLQHQWMLVNEEVTQVSQQNLAFSADGGYLACLTNSSKVGDRHVLQLIDPKTGVIIWKTEIRANYDAMPTRCISFDSTGSLIVVGVRDTFSPGCKETYVLVFDVFTGRRLARPQPIMQWDKDYKTYNSVASIQNQRVSVESKFWWRLLDGSFERNFGEYDGESLDDPCKIYACQTRKGRWLTMDSHKLIYLPTEIIYNVVSYERQSGIPHRYHGYDVARDVPYFIDISCRRCRTNVE